MNKKVSNPNAMKAVSEAPGSPGSPASSSPPAANSSTNFDATAQDHGSDGANGSASHGHATYNWGGPESKVGAIS